MTKEELIRNLKYTMEKHKNDKVDTFGTNISLMCKDVLDYIEQQPSEDCVSRKAVIDELNRLGRNAFKDDTDYDTLFDFIDSLPPALEERKQRHWIEHYDNSGNLHHLECSSCHNWHRDFIKDDFCPNCGADMRGSNNE